MNSIYKQIVEKLKSQTGAMDKILVTLLLVIVGVVALIAIESWFTGQKEAIRNEANTQISNVVSS